LKIKTKSQNNVMGEVGRGVEW